MIITLCGSTKFKDDFMKEAARLTMGGHIIFMPHVFAHTDCIKLSKTDKERLDELHKTKIRMSDRVHVINPTGYVGESTTSEIMYARSLHIPVTVLKELQF